MLGEVQMLQVATSRMSDTIIADYSIRARVVADFKQVALGHINGQIV